MHARASTRLSRPIDAPHPRQRLAATGRTFSAARAPDLQQPRSARAAVRCRSHGPAHKGTSSPVETLYYELLGVGVGASHTEIKRAYRLLALRLHPDVSDAPDAAQRFAAMAAAYDVLSDSASRALYDRHGAEGMRGRAGAGGGAGNASRFWDEFKPFTKSNKRTRARDAAASTASGDSDDAAAGGGGSGPWHGLPAAGAVVEYPLPAVVRQELQDGRSHGVGLLVGRNCDRGDAARLPPEALDLCEVEPLRQEEAGSARWVPDELSPSTYVRLPELRPVPVAAYDHRWDVWTIRAPLSDGCGGPELGEEVML